MEGCFKFQWGEGFQMGGFIFKWGCAPLGGASDLMGGFKKIVAWGERPSLMLPPLW